MIKLSKFATVMILSLYLIGCGGGGGSGGGDDGGFPTPRLPADAAKIDPAKAVGIADSALEFAGILFAFAPKTEGPPSIPQVIKLLTDRVANRNRNSGTETAAKEEDLSAVFCSDGTAIDTYEETLNGDTGVIRFSNCDLGGGILLNGPFSYEGSWNATTLNYNSRVGGSLTFASGSDRIIVVLNFLDTGNNGTGDFALSLNFSLSGIPGGGYLLTTVKPLLGSIFAGDITSGELSVKGADNTQLCMTVTSVNTVTVEFDDGLGGGCVPLVPQLDIAIII